MTQNPLLFCGNSNPQLAEEIAKRLRLHVGKALVSEFKNEETRVEIGENVRGSEVFVVQSICKAPNGKGVNDAVMELLLMIDALRRASAARITAVIPYYGYAKQDKKTKGREPISAKVIANLLKVTGARRIVTMDLHAAQIQGFFDIPVDNLMAMPVLCNYLKKEGLCDDKIVVVSPDAGGVHRAEIFAKRLNSSLAIVFKRRPEPDVSEVTDIVGDVAGKVAVVVDDMISTGGTLAKAAEAIKARGATRVYTVASHGHLRRRRGRGARAVGDREGARSPTRCPSRTGPTTRSSSSSRSPRSSPTRSAESRPTARSPSSSPGRSRRTALLASRPNRLRRSSQIVYKRKPWLPKN